MRSFHRMNPFKSLLLATLIYSPAAAHAQTHPWRTSTDMAEGRYAATVTALPQAFKITTIAEDGTETIAAEDGILIAGGFNGRTLTTAQLYTPSRGLQPTGSLFGSRNFATATLLNNGNVLIAGGYKEDSTGAGSLATAELYDPSTGTFRKNPYLLNSARELYTATKLPNGKVLLVGGFKTGFGGGTLRSAEIYDPTTGTFAYTGSMQTPYGRFGHDAIPLDLNATDGVARATHVLIVGGKERRSSSDWRSLNNAELYDIAAGTFAFTKTSAGVQTLMKYTRDRVAVAWIEAEKKVLVVGGKAESLGVSDDVTECEWFDPATQTFSPGPSLNQGRMAHSLTTFTTKAQRKDASGQPYTVELENVLVAGGWSVRADSTVSSAERLIVDPDAPGVYRFVAVGPMAHSSHDHGAAFIGGEVLVVGGKKHQLNETKTGHITEWLKRVEFYSPSIYNPVHDVAVASVTAPATVGSGSLATISVVVRNEGSYVESLKVSLAHTTAGVSPGSILNNDQIVTLGAGDSRTLGFTWDTNGASLGTHTWEATAALTDSTLAESTTANNAASGTSTVEIPPAPAAPTNLAASALGSKLQVKLSWTDNATNEAGYRVQRSANQSTWTDVKTLSANAVTHTDTVPAAGTYYYRVQAYNSGGTATSSVVSVRVRK
jgi:hypothetical protein